MNVQPYIDWARQNPEAVVAIVVYLVVNFAPRKHPDEAKGWRRLFWLLLDRLAFLTHDKIPGCLKMIFMGSPVVSDSDSGGDKRK